MQIFQSNIVRLAYLILPPHMRSSTLMAIARTCVVPIEQLRGKLLTKRDDVAYWLGITPQICYLKKALNDTFDSVKRRINIETVYGTDLQLIHSDSALKPVYIGTDDSNGLLLIHTNAGYSDGGYDFIVYKNGVTLTDSQDKQLKTIVNNYKLPDKQADYRD